MGSEMCIRDSNDTSTASSTKEVRLTPEHPVYVMNRLGEELGWIMAGDLVSGDLIADIDGGQLIKIVNNTLTQTEETVYNFEVEEAHSYFADELGLWVHNPSSKFFRAVGAAAALYFTFDDDPRTRAPRARLTEITKVIEECEKNRKPKAGGPPKPRRKFPLPK